MTVVARENRVFGSKNRASFRDRPVPRDGYALFFTVCKDGHAPPAPLAFVDWLRVGYNLHNTMRSVLRKLVLSAVGVLAGVKCFGPGAAIAVDGGEWVPLASMNMARQEVGAARIGNTVYVVGGLVSGPGFTATATVEAYDIIQNTWSFVAPLPVALHHMGVAALDGKLYVMGGYLTGSFQARSEVRVYDPVQNSWSDGPALPSARGACWAVAHQGRIYLFGGRDAAGVTRRTTFIFDPSSNMWSTGADMPTAREHLTAAALGGFVYVIGGRNGPSNNLNERYDPVDNQWATLAPMPTARSATATAAFGGKIYVAGGETPMLFDVHEVYDPDGDSWSTSKPMPIPRHGIAAVPLDDRILTPAGGTVQGLAPTSEVDSFVPGQPAPAVSSCGLFALGVLLSSVAAARIRRSR